LLALGDDKNKKGERFGSNSPSLHNHIFIHSMIYIISLFVE